jgi:hypothetical protein
LHVKLLLELHSVDSPEVWPTPTLAEFPYIPSPEPITTISSFPGSIRLDVPNIDTAPNIPYKFLTNKHYLYDLVYNPAKTLFLQLGEQQGAVIENGTEMLHLQAEEGWRIWNS